MPVYEYKGQHYDIDTTDSAEAKRKILLSLQPAETALQSFGRSAASLADSVLGMPGAMVGEVAYAGSRMAGQSPEQATQAAQQFHWDNKIGKLAGVTGTAGYENAPQRELGRYIGEGLQQNVIAPAAEFTGLPEQDVSNMTNTLMMGAGPVVPKVAAGTGRAIGTGVTAVKDFGAGAVGRARGSTARPGEVSDWARPSARQPVSPEGYISPEQLTAWRGGQISTADAVAGRVPWTPAQTRALTRTGGNVPFKGQAARAAGEQFIEPYTSLTGFLPDIGLALAGTALSLGPALGPMLNIGRKIYSASKTAKDLQAARSLSGVGLTPLTAAEQAALKSGAPNPNAKPPPQQPSQPPAMTTQAELPGFESRPEFNLESPPGTVAQQISLTRAELSSKEAAQTAAASRITDPKALSILDQIRTRKQEPAAGAGPAPDWQQRAMAAGGYTPPRAEMAVKPQPLPKADPVVTTFPVGPEPFRVDINGTRDSIPRNTTASPVAPTPISTTESTLASLKSKLVPQTAAELASVEAYQALPKAEKAAQTRAETAARKSEEIPAVKGTVKYTATLKPQEAKKSIAEFDANGKPYDITYNTAKGKVKVVGNTNVNFKLDPDLTLNKLTTTSVDDSYTGVGQGLYNGQPAILEINLVSGEGKVYNVNKKILKIYKKE